MPTRIILARHGETDWNRERRWQGHSDRPLNDTGRAQAEKLLHVRDAKTARETFRDLAQRWDAAGKVPRSDVKELEARFGRVEQTIRSAEDDRWRRSNPEAYARAAATVTQLEASIAASKARLEQARARGDEKAATQAQADVAARESWLEQARKALQEFST